MESISDLVDDSVCATEDSVAAIERQRNSEEGKASGTQCHEVPGLPDCPQTGVVNLFRSREQRRPGLRSVVVVSEFLHCDS